MSLTDYHKMMNEIDGRPNKEDHPDITRKEFDFREGEGKDGSATIVFLKGEPIYLNWYIWSLDDNWMMEQINNHLGYEVIRFNYSGGNGHMSAEIKRK